MLYEPLVDLSVCYELLDDLVDLCCELIISLSHCSADVLNFSFCSVCIYNREMII